VIVGIITIMTVYICTIYHTRYVLRALGIVAIPFIKLYQNRRIAAGLEDGSRKTERFGIPSHVRPFGKLIWIHAVSVGEVLSVIPFIEEFRKVNGSVNVVLTTTTLTAANLIKERFPETIIHQFIPFDVLHWIRRFVKFWGPDAVFFVESELWPNTLFYLAELDIPTYLLNTRISNKTLKRMYLAKKIFNYLPFKPFREVFITSQEMKMRVLELGAQAATINPNMKIISNMLPFDKDVAADLKRKFRTRSVWIAVSTHRGEEEIIIEAHKKIGKSCEKVLTVIAIRHPERAEEVSELCKTLGMSFILHTVAKEQKFDIREDIYIIDQIGCLGDFFEAIDTALICGSLIPGIGGHNMLEPLHFMCNIITGQFTENCEDLYQAVQDICPKVYNIDELSECVSYSIHTYKRTIAGKNNKSFISSWQKSIKQISMALYGRS
jgi:3-deoxy-D-manno-octulosonic-acid transferase